MTRERWQEIESIYHAAYARAGGDREQFLGRVCGADAELRREVESLLDMEGRAAAFLEAPAITIAAADLARDPEPSRIGETIAGYRIVSLLGAGGMGEVYRATDLRLGRDVALKLLAPGMVAGADRRRFEEEARSASALAHPNIVTIHAVGEDGETAYIAMEIVHGRTLRSVLDGGPMTVDETLDLATQLADALAAAHARGIVHRDLKPENIIVTPEGRLKVLDFGIAKRSGTGGDADDGAIRGTARYMSPEQATGGVVGAQSDQFAFGAIVYEMLAGRRAFEGVTRQEIVSALVGEQPSMERLPADAPLRQLVARCLVKDPGSRFSQSQDLAVELRALRARRVHDRIRSGLTRRTAMQLGGAAAIAAVTGLAAWRYWPRTTRSIAVLPFVNGALDENAEFLCDGLAQQVVARLALLSSLRVLPASASYNFKGTTVDVREAGRRLKVDAVLSGTLARVAGNIRISTELLDVPSGTIVSRHVYEHAATELLALHQEIAGMTAGELGVRATGAERSALARLPTTDGRSFSLFLQAAQLLRRQSEEDYLRARELLQEAVKSDPRFALAHATLASTYSVMAIDGFEHPADAWRHQRASATRALELDPDLPEGRAESATALFFADWKWQEAGRAWDYALRARGGSMDPDLLISYALQRWALGRPDLALQLARQVRAIDALTPAFAVKEADFTMHTRDLDGAARLYEQIFREMPASDSAVFGLAEVRRRQGRFEDALATLGRGDLADHVGSQTALLLLTARGEQGFREVQHALARHELDRLTDRAASGAYVSPLLFAHALARLGDGDRALHQLKAALEHRAAGLVFLNVDPSWDALRTHQSFRDAVRQVGLP
jgi:TolB-like protein/tetratricopeptide (TPR) repeat protein